MPRAKQTGEVGQIICPACQSKISSDGKALHSRSEFLTDLIEGEEDFKKAESAIERLETQLKEAKEKVTKLEAELRLVVSTQSAPAKEAESGKKSRVGRLW